MHFQSKKEFEAHIRELLITKVLPFDKNLVMIRSKKAVDILICRNGKIPALYFIEIKYHKNKHGRLGTGMAKVEVFNRRYYNCNPITSKSKCVGY